MLDTRFTDRPGERVSGPSEPLLRLFTAAVAAGIDLEARLVALVFAMVRMFSWGRAVATFRREAERSNGWSLRTLQGASRSIRTEAEPFAEDALGRGSRGGRAGEHSRSRALLVLAGPFDTPSRGLSTARASQPKKG